jgi:predicted Fe-Mo cluster-binding NifX family protein
VVANPGHAPGAIPKFLHNRGVKKIVCGGIGARAVELFRQYGIAILTGVEGTIDETVRKLVEGKLTGGESLCKPGAGRGYGIEKTECDHAHEEIQ